MSVPPPGNILRYAIGPWMCGILAAAVRLDAFACIEGGASDADSLAAAASITARGAQALLDGLLGLGLVTLDDGVYRNTPEAAQYLLQNRLEYLGHFVQLGAADMAAWSRLAEVVESGEPVLADFDPAGHPDWEGVVRGIAPLALFAARTAAADLGIEHHGHLRMLDLGGGAGAFAAVWLALNSEARAMQLDWQNVNAVAREYVGGLGVGDRFETRDGDLRELDYGEGEFDFVVFSLVSHFFPADDNRAVLGKIHRALSEGGTLVLADLMTDEQGGAPLWPLAFHANMLLSTRHGTAHRRSDYERWAAEAGFGDIRFAEIAGMPHTLLYARRLKG